MGSLVLRPVGTVSTNHTLYPAGSVAHTLVDEETSDGDSTYLQLSVTSDKNTSAETVLKFSGKLPSKNVIIKSIDVHVTAKCSTTSLANRRTNVLFEWTGTKVFTTNSSLTTSYVDSSVNVTEVVSYLQDLITDEGELSFEMTSRSVGAKSTDKNASSGTIRITQVYIVINYEEKIERLMIKTNGTYMSINKMYVKEKGIWMQKDIKEFFHNKENNTKFEYIYGGDIE